MISHFLSVPMILVIFSIGYLGIIFEHIIKLNKSAIALTIATLCWSIYFISDGVHLTEDLGHLGHHLSDISQIIFFLMGAMTLVELVDSHKGFKLITDFIHTRSKRKLLWIIAGISFFLSGMLDNLTTTILMISLLSKIIPLAKDRILFSCIIVIAANAGGAWTPIGDVTTTMLWINGQLSSLAVIKALFLPSLLSLLVPLVYYSFTIKGSKKLPEIKKEHQVQEPGAKIVFLFGIGGLVFVPIFKAITGLPPFVGMLLALGIVWLITDFIHRDHDYRTHLRVPSILSKIDTSSVLFFLGILLSVAALQTAGLLDTLATWLIQDVKSLPLIATLIGFFSAIIDNVPLVAATMGMYPTTQFPMDSSFWHMIAYAAGTGGSLLIIGSSAGVAMMGMEKMDFITYLKKATLPTLIGYLAGMGLYLAL
ncbi:MAG: sodium:proton antiporter NhaD [Verrucomicrobia bacterium]|nr:sodium:proton antiporter NhaD [Verrucomicrobiota bacterium]